MGEQRIPRPAFNTNDIHFSNDLKFVLLCGKRDGTRLPVIRLFAGWEAPDRRWRQRLSEKLLRILTVEGAGEGAFESFVGCTGDKIAVGGQVIGQHVREQDCWRNVRCDVLQRGDKRLQLLFHPHVDIDRRVLLNLADFQKAVSILFLVLLTGLSAFGGFYSG